MANEIIKGMGFQHIALKAADFDTSLKFYEALGFTFFTQWGEGDGRIAMLDCGDGGILELFAGGNCDEQANAKYIHFAYNVDDVDAAFATAVAAGAKPKMNPKVVPVHSAPVDLTLNCAFVFGPSGEEIEFFKILERK